MRRRDPYALVALHRLMVVWLIVKLGVWAAFLLVFPAMCLLRGLDGAAVLLGALGLLLDIKALDLLLTWARGWAPALQKLAIAYHALITLAGLVILFMPIDPRWTLLPDTDDLSDITVVWFRDGLMVGSGGGSNLTLINNASEQLPYANPGGPSWILQTAPDGALWTAPRLSDTLQRLDTDGWTQIPRPTGYVRALAIGEDELWLVTNTLHMLDLRQMRWAMPTVVDLATGVSLAPDTGDVLVTGRSSWHIRSAVDHTWTDVTPHDIADLGVRHPEAASGGAGWHYVITRGIFSSTMHVRSPEDPVFAPRTPPAGDLRTLVADPRDGRHAFVCTWGEGIHETHDGGHTWTDLGLHRVQVETIAVDWQLSRIAAGNRNTIFDKGVYIREVSP